MIMFQDEPLETNAAGKIPKIGLRLKAKQEWERRQGAKKQSGKGKDKKHLSSKLKEKAKL
jgi:hypothetical protein